MKKTVSIIIALAVIAMVIIITIQNSKEVIFRLLGWKVEASLILIIFVAFLSGALSTLLFILPSMIRKKKINEESKQNDQY
ncbi:MAG: LapA family protein [Bacteroidales bacterium]|nr:LapA family protein [Bacteroidales bacterium]